MLIKKGRIMDVEEIKSEIDLLFEYLTDERAEKLESVLNNRTEYLSVVLEDIYHSHNASAVIRTCDCFGIQNLHVIENIKKNRVNKCVTQGAGKWVTIKKYTEDCNNTENCLNALKEKGYKIVGTALNSSKLIDIDELPIFDSKLALCFGCEEKGMSDKALDMSDYVVKIPMYGFTQSFNVSVSVAILLQMLTRKLHKSTISWRLAEIKKLRLKHEWIKASVKNSDLLLKRLQQF
jgi:tRNA (guanosine-2'-O-)-methyltransferase